MITTAKMRIILRWTHIGLGLILMCYIYSPFHELKSFQIAVKFIIIPAITFTGVWVWKFQAFNRFFGIK